MKLKLNLTSLAFVALQTIAVMAYDQDAYDAAREGVSHLAYKDLSGADFENFSFPERVNLYQTNFSNANLAGGTLSKARATEATFIGAKLMKVRQR